MKTTIKIITIFISIMFLMSCMTMQQARQQRQAKQTRFTETIPVCVNEADCKEKWSAAQAWVASNCGMKVQIVTDTIIETYNSPRASTTIACRVIKEPIGNGEYKIVINVWCNNIFACYPDNWEAAIDFNLYVGKFGITKTKESI